MENSQFDKLKNFRKKILDLYDYVDTLSLKDKEEMILEIDKWDDDLFSQSKLILENYAKIEVSTKLIKEVFKNNLIVSCEAYLKTIDDTVGREMLFDALVKYLNVRDSWPKYSDRIDINEFINNQVKPMIEKKEIELYIGKKEQRKRII